MALRYLVNSDIATYGHLLVDDQQPATSDWATRSDVKVWWNKANPGQGNNITKGNLDVGYASSSTRIGPEYGFGWQLGDYYPKSLYVLRLCFYSKCVIWSQILVSSSGRKT